MPDNPGPPDIYEQTPDFFQPIQFDLHATDSTMGREETDQSAVCGQKQPVALFPIKPFDSRIGTGTSRYPNYCYANCRSMKRERHLCV
jgi:hypothetical protein